MRKIYLTWFAAILVPVIYMSLAACRKDVRTPAEKPLTVQEINNTSDPSQPVITISPNSTLLPTKEPNLNFIFDWEQATTMPVPPGQPAVPMPWSDLTIRNYDPGLRYDFKKSDGWELVYNTFHDSIVRFGRNMVLYNKFRGLYRFYTYNPKDVSSSLNEFRWLANEVSLYSPGNNSPLINFAGQFIVDVDVNSSTASLAEPWHLQEGAWYISQFEVAYDQHAANLKYPNSVFSWDFAFGRIDDLQLNGVPATNHSIYLQAPGVSFQDKWSYLVQLTGDFNLQVKSQGGFDNLSGILSTTTINNLKQAADEGRAGNMLNATLVPGAGIVNCKIEMPGILKTLPSMVLYTSPSTAIPGADNSGIVGIGPNFNEPMGIFYLGAKPVINYSQVDGELSEQYSLDVSSLEYIINPFVPKYADVVNFQQEIVAVDEKETKSQADAKIYAGKILKASKPLKILGVRVSLEVKPKNGSAPVKLIKTFAAKINS